jgi:hypothetical protein
MRLPILFYLQGLDWQQQLGTLVILQINGETRRKVDQNQYKIMEEEFQESEACKADLFF